MELHSKSQEQDLQLGQTSQLPLGAAPTLPGQVGWTENMQRPQLAQITSDKRKHSGPLMKYLNIYSSFFVAFLFFFLINLQLQVQELSTDPVPASSWVKPSFHEGTSSITSTSDGDGCNAKEGPLQPLQLSRATEIVGKKSPDISAS